MTTTNEAKPYTNEELEGLRAAGTGVYVGAGVYFGAVDQHALRRLLATLDERDRRLAEAMPPRALREWREALGEYAPEDTGGWSPLVGATHAVVQALDERTRERDEARVTIAEACDLVGDGGDGTLFGRCESLLLEAAALRERLSVVEREMSEARRRLVALLSVPPPDDLPLWDEGGSDVVRCIETIMGEMGAVVLAKPVDPETAALRKEAEQAKTRLCESLGLNPAATWQQISEEVEDYVGNALALPNVEHQLEQAQARVDALRDALDSVAVHLGVDTSSDADAEALEEAARVCDRLHDVWRAAATNAYHEGGADALDVAGQEVRSLSPKEEPSPSPTGRETP